MILIISDYHGREQEVLRLIDEYQPELILCCGDGQSNDQFYRDHNIISVAGNCDTAQLNKVEVVEWHGKRIMLTHGHLYNVYFDFNTLYYAAKEQMCDLVFYGHTHVQKQSVVSDVTFVNPGAVIDGNYALMDDEGIILK